MKHRIRKVAIMLIVLCLTLVTTMPEVMAASEWTMLQGGSDARVFEFSNTNPGSWSHWNAGSGDNVEWWIEADLAQMGVPSNIYNHEYKLTVDVNFETQSFNDMEWGGLTIHDVNGNRIDTKNPYEFDGYDHDNIKTEIYLSNTSKVKIKLYGINVEYGFFGSAGIDIKFNNLKVTIEDTGNPHITNVTTDKSQGDYNKTTVGQPINIFVEFNEKVIYTGDIGVKVGGVDRTAKYKSGSGTSTLNFEYIIEDDIAGEFILNEPNKLSKIKDLAGLGCDSNLTGKIQNKSIYIDTIAPIIEAIEFANEDENHVVYGVGDSIDIYLRLHGYDISSEPPTHLRLNNNKQADYVGLYDAVVPHYRYTVEAGDDEEKLSVIEVVGGNITDLVGNPLDSTIGDGVIENVSIQIDTIPPAIEMELDSPQSWSKSHSVWITKFVDESFNEAKYYWDISSTIDEDWSTITNQLTEGALEIDSVSGQYYLHVFADDKAENTLEETYGPFYLDNEMPKIDITNNVKKNQLIIDANDDYSGINNIDYDWMKWDEVSESYGTYLKGTIDSGEAVGIPNDDGKFQLKVSATDYADNTSIKHSAEFLIDAKSIKIDFPEGSGDDTAKKTVSVKVSLSDDKENDGSAFYLWSDSMIQPDENDDRWEEFYNGNIGTEPIIKTIISPENLDGTWYLYIKGYDDVRNIVYKNTNGYILDNTLPSLNFTQDGLLTLVKNINTQLQVNESSDYTIWYEITDTPVSDYNEDTMSISSDGVFKLENMSGRFYIHVKVTDQADNTTNLSSNAFYLDNISPIGNLDIANDYEYTKGQVYLNLDAEDSTVDMSNGEIITSQPAEMSFSTDDGNTWGSWLPYSSTESITIEGNEGEHIISVRFKDVAGNISDTYKDTIILDTTPPEIVSITYDPDTTEETPTDVIVTVEASDNYTNPELIQMKIIDRDTSVSLLDNSNKLNFKNNGNCTIEISDLAGNKTIEQIQVNHIKKVEGDYKGPIPNLIYTSGIKQWNSPKDEFWTNQDVTVTLMFEEDGTSANIINNDGSNQYVFEENGFFIFEIEDEEGNTGEVTAIVTKIDREIPNPVVTFSEKNWTNQPVVVSIAFDNEFEEVTILNNDGNNEKSFYENGSFIFEFEDAAGNYGTYEVNVGNIDKENPEAEISYSHTVLTNSNVLATVFPNEEVTFLSDDSYEFKENGTYLFEFKDRAGNVGSALANVDIIDRKAPSVDIAYSTKELTKENVVVTVSGKNGEDIYILNNSQKNQYIFTENGSFTFMVSDIAGNKTEITAQVNNIDKSLPDIELSYSTKELTKENVFVTINSDRNIEVFDFSGKKFMNNIVEFKENGYKLVKIIDDLGNELKMTVVVDNIDRESPRIEFLTGDILIVSKDSQFDPLQDVRVIDNLDTILTENVTVNNGVNTSVLGDYKITYTVMDKAGNQTVLERIIRVIDPSNFEVYINSQKAEDKVLVFFTNKVGLKLFGVEGEVKIKWLEDKLFKGEFKACQNIIEGPYLEFEKGGFYSIYIQDQERRTKLVHIYVIYTQE